MAAAQEEESILRHRLLTHTAVSKGDPPFQKLAKRYMQLCEAIEAGKPANEVEEAYKAVLKELTAIQFQMQKMEFQCDALQREQQFYQDKQAKLQDEITQAQHLIEQRKRELHEARIWKKNQEDYEGLKKMIMDQPSRQETAATISKIEAEIASLEAQKEAAVLALQKRQKQFALLLYCIDELQSSTNVDDEVLAMMDGPAEQMQVD